MFIFDTIKPEFDQKRISFSYKLIHTGVEYSFTEVIHLPSVPQHSIPDALLQQVLQGVHLILGISYWKLYCPKEIKINDYDLSKEQAEFWNTVYTKGLGEFFYTNKVDYRGLVSFPYVVDSNMQSVPCEQKDRSLVGIGGGKDSIVTVELLKQAGHEFDGFVVDTQKEYPLIENIIDLMNIQAVHVKRQIDSQLFTLSKQSDTYNGHVPISAVYAFLGLLTAILYDYSSFIVSNERSSNIGNREYLGDTINHQWSKSAEFEQMMRTYIHTYITPSIDYVSVLRPYTEFKIVELFARYPQYFHAFSSCNRNFNITTKQHQLWCGTCPKCTFVFAMLSAFLPKKELVELFRNNLFAHESLVPLYKELLGLAGFKPFECVGTPDEVQVALWRAHEKGEYEEDVIMKLFVAEVLPQMNGEKVKQEVHEVDYSVLPEKWRKVLI